MFKNLFKKSPKLKSVDIFPEKPNDNLLKFRIVESTDGRFFPQMYGFLWGENTWLWLNEFRAKEGKDAWYTFYKFEVAPLELQYWCYDKAECKRIIREAKKFFEERAKAEYTNDTSTSEIRIKSIHPC